MPSYIRFVDVPEGVESRQFGPYPFIQVTYTLLRVGPDGDELAAYKDGRWHPDVPELGGRSYTDFIVTSEKERD